MNKEQRQVGYDLLVDLSDELLARDLHIQHLKSSRRDAWRLLSNYTQLISKMSLYEHVKYWFSMNYLRRVTDTERQAYYNLKNLLRRN